MQLPVRPRSAVKILGALGGLVAVAFTVGVSLHRLDARRLPERATRLAAALNIGPGSTVAEVGAGTGLMALEIARRVGPGGAVIATELGEDQLKTISRAAAGAGLANVTVLPAGEHDSNLPAGCCDAVYLQRVYHHLADPAPVIVSVSRALKPGGRLALLEFEPGWIANLTTPAGVPERGGHGVPKSILVREMKAHGFEPVGTIEDFDGELYLAVFRRAPDRDRHALNLHR